MLWMTLNTIWIAQSCFEKMKWMLQDGWKIIMGFLCVWWNNVRLSPPDDFNKHILV